MFAGTRLFVESAWVKRKKSTCLELYTKSTNLIEKFDDSGLTMTMEQVVTQLQQEVFTLKTQVADRSGRADAARVFNNIATAQSKKYTASPIEVKSLRRPK